MVNQMIKMERIREYNTDIFSDNKSPFAVVSGERINVKAVQQPSHPIQLTDIDRIVIHLSNVFLLFTSQLMLSALQNLGIEISKVDVQRRLKKLCDCEYLTQMEFATDDRKSSGKIYKIGRRGAGYIIGSENSKVNKSSYVAGLDPAGMKKILAALQYAIRSGVQPENIIMAEACVSEMVKKDSSKLIFRPHCTLQLENNTIFVEAIRKNEGSIKEFMEKLKRIVAVIKSGRMNIRCISPKLIIIAEERKQVKDIVSAINHEYHSAPLPILFSSDAEVYRDAKNCLTAFERQNFFDFLFS